MIIVILSVIFVVRWAIFHENAQMMTVVDLTKGATYVALLDIYQEIALKQMIPFVTGAT